MTKSNKAIYWIVGLAVLAAAAIAGLLALGSDSSANNAAAEVDIRTNGLVYVADLNAVGEPERWKYAVRNDDTCNGSVFSNGGRRNRDNLRLGYDYYNDAPAYVIYGSREFSALDFGDYVDRFDGKYICFSALLTTGSWVYGSTRLDLVFGGEADETVSSAVLREYYGELESHYAKIHDQGCATRDDLLALYYAVGEVSETQTYAIAAWASGQETDADLLTFHDSLESLGSYLSQGYDINDFEKALETPCGTAIQPEA